MAGMIGLICALGLLIFLTMRGVNIIIAALLCSIVVAITGGLNVETALMKYYMTGFTGYFKSWFLIFLLGAIFGKVMQNTGAADSIANWVKSTLGPSKAVLAVVAAAAIMTYGGISLFVVGFSVYPIALSVFKVANYPHRFIPAALVFGSISFTDDRSRFSGNSKFDTYSIFRYHTRCRGNYRCINGTADHGSR